MSDPARGRNLSFDEIAYSEKDDKEDAVAVNMSRGASESTLSPKSKKKIMYPPTIDAADHGTVKARTMSADSSDELTPTSLLRVTSDDDDDLRVAKEMALALQQNPDLSPELVREMVLKRSASKSSSTKTKVTKKIKSGVKSAVSPVAHAAKQTSKTVQKATTKASDAVTKASHKVSKVTAKATAKVVGGKSSSSSKNKAPGGPMRERTSGSEDTGGLMSSSGSAGDDNVPSPRLQASTSQTSLIDSAGEESNRLSSRVSRYDPFGGEGAAPIRLTAIVWKRRSGFGKYSTTTAWERRRIVLRGPRLYYYKTQADNADDDSERQLQHGDSEYGMDLTGAKKAPSSWLQQATANVTSLAAQVSITGSSAYPLVGASASGESDSARGYLDLVKDNASVSASYGHTGAPTPFALSIKVLTQTKWKFCFDTQRELMEWLAAMTDVVVQGSVDSYNAQIVRSAAADPTFSSMGQLSEPPLTAVSKSKNKNASPSDAASGGHRLWMTGPYTIKYREEFDQELEDELNNQVLDDSDDEGASSEKAIVKSSRELPLEEVAPELLADTWWNIPERYFFYGAILVNSALVVARASATSVDTFWMVLIFTNVALHSLFTKDSSKEITVVSTTEATGKSQIMIRRTLLVTTSSSVSPRGGRSLTRMASTSTLDPASEQKRKSSMSHTITEESSKEVSAKLPESGTTSMQIANPTDLPVNKDGVVFAGWRTAKPDSINVRSHGYLTTKKKVPAPAELYKCTRVDIFESDHRYPDMAGRVKLPKVEFDDGGLPKTWNAPDIFIVSIAIPTSPPKLRSSDDGGGYTITVYFTMRQETRDILRRVTADGYDPSTENVDDVQKSMVNAVRLLDEWCRRAPTDDTFMARFKCIPNALNLKEIGMPSWISKYNAKPFLIKRPGQTGFLFRHPSLSCVEFDISLHPFPYLAKQGICFMKDSYFKKVLCTFGFLIEGRSDDELPECFIGLMQLCYPDPVHAIQASDFFAGRSPKSFEPS